MAQPRVVIVGGGIIGCASAYELAKAGYGVTVIERGTCLLYTSPSPRD